MNHYFIAFSLGVLVALLICKNFYILRKNQNAHIFCKMLQNAFRDIGYKHDNKKGTKLRIAIAEELSECISYLKQNEDFMPNNMKKWIQKSVAKSEKAYDYLNRYYSIKIDKDSFHAHLMCRGEKSFQYVSLVDLVINLLYAQDHYKWGGILFCSCFDTS